MTTRDRRGTSSPESDGNSWRPVTVRKVTSTRASAANGSSSTSHCDTPRTVVPAAKYQSVPAVVAHGTVESRLSLSSPAETTTSDENGSTTIGPAAVASCERLIVKTEACGIVSTLDTGFPPSSGCTVTTARAAPEPRLLTDSV